MAAMWQNAFTQTHRKHINKSADYPPGVHQKSAGSVTLSVTLSFSFKAV